MNREQAEHLAFDYLYGQMGPAEVGAFEEMLRDSEELRAALDGLRRIRGAARRMPPFEVPAVSLDEILATAREAGTLPVLPTVDGNAPQSASSSSIETEETDAPGAGALTAVGNQDTGVAPLGQAYDDAFFRAEATGSEDGAIAEESVTPQHDPGFSLVDDESREEQAYSEDELQGASDVAEEGAVSSQDAGEVAQELSAALPQSGLQTHAALSEVEAGGAVFSRSGLAVDASHTPVPQRVEMPTPDTRQLQTPARGSGGGFSWLQIAAVLAIATTVGAISFHSLFPGGMKFRSEAEQAARAPVSPTATAVVSAAGSSATAKPLMTEKDEDRALQAFGSLIKGSTDEMSRKREESVGLQDHALAGKTRQGAGGKELPASAPAGAPQMASRSLDAESPAAPLVASAPVSSAEVAVPAAPLPDSGKWKAHDEELARIVAQVPPPSESPREPSAGQDKAKSGVKAGERYAAAAAAVPTSETGLGAESAAARGGAAHQSEAVAAKPAETAAPSASILLSAVPPVPSDARVGEGKTRESSVSGSAPQNLMGDITEAGKDRLSVESTKRDDVPPVGTGAVAKSSEMPRDEIPSETSATTSAPIKKDVSGLPMVSAKPTSPPPAVAKQEATPEILSLPEPSAAPVRRDVSGQEPNAAEKDSDALVIRRSPPSLAESSARAKSAAPSATVSSAPSVSAVPPPALPARDIQPDAPAPDTERVQSLLAEARHLQAYGTHERAIAVANQALRLNPPAPLRADLLALKVRSLLAVKRYEPMDETIRQLRAVDPVSAQKLMDEYVQALSPAAPVPVPAETYRTPVPATPNAASSSSPAEPEEEGGNLMGKLKNLIRGQDKEPAPRKAPSSRRLWTTDAYERSE